MKFERVSMRLGESVREYVARAKALAYVARYHNVEAEDEVIHHRILTDPPLISFNILLPQKPGAWPR